MVQITNHIERALILLAAQFRETKPDNSPTDFQKLIRAFVSEMQDAENVNWQLYSERSIFTAEGAQLDGLGQILGIDRLPGESDDDYRERLLFQAYINNSTGTPEELIRILKFLTKASEVRYLEIYPAAYQLITDGETFPDPPNQLVEAIASAAPAGVQYPIITCIGGIDVPVTFGLDPVTDLLVVTDPADPSNLLNLEVYDGTNTYLLEVNANRIPFNDSEGYLAEVFLDYSVDTQGAGQLAEVLTINSNQPPPN